MGEKGSPGGKRWRRRGGAAVVAGLILLALAGLVPAALVAADWALAVRTARSTASDYAWNRAGVRFLGQDWRPARIDPRIVALRVEEPPGSGAYAGYAHASHVELLLQWQPPFRAFAGGPYRIRGRATAAVLRGREGKWMPVLVD